VVVAAPVAQELGAALTVIHTHKLSSPQAPEFAFGAIDEDAQAIIDHRAVVALGLGTEGVKRIEAEVAAEVARRRSLYPGRVRVHDHDLRDRAVVLVDDGLATGLTMRAAVGYAQRHGVKATIVAVPCASLPAAREIQGLLQRRGDHFVCPLVDPHFRAVGDYYEDFRQVSDAEVAELLGRGATLPARDRAG
jgi:putative phosphoribosyl transferase